MPPGRRGDAYSRPMKRRPSAGASAGEEPTQSAPEKTPHELAACAIEAAHAAVVGPEVDPAGVQRGGREDALAAGIVGAQAPPLDAARLVECAESAVVAPGVEAASVEDRGRFRHDVEVVGIPGPASPHRLESGPGPGLGRGKRIEPEIRDCQQRVHRDATPLQALVQVRVAEIHHHEEGADLPARFREHAAQGLEGRAPVGEVVHRDDGRFGYLSLDAAVETVRLALPAYDESVDGRAPPPPLSRQRHDQRHRRQFQAADLKGQARSEAVPEDAGADFQRLRVEQGRTQIDHPPILVPERRDDPLLRIRDHGASPHYLPQPLEPCGRTHLSRPRP